MTGLAVTKLNALTIPQLAEEALWQELTLTPKPGLVDRRNNGAHRDMDYGLFTRSIAAIAPWLTRFAEHGFAQGEQPAHGQLCRLRPMGIACEQAMYHATDGVNTHKGGVFALGLLCFAGGRLYRRGERLSADNLCREVSELCQGLVAKELATCHQATTAGERQYQQYGLTGARGEAEQGFITLRQHVLPYWYQEPVERRLHHALLRLMAVNPDSNLVSRGGIAGLNYVQHYAQKLLKTGWDNDSLSLMDDDLITRHLSPGGSADLLSVAWVLVHCG